MSQALDFLSAIFHDKPNSHNILIWTLNRQKDVKRNTFFTSIQEAATFATSVNDPGTDVYFCVGTLPKLKTGRGKLEDVLGIGSIHIDIDVASADKRVHKKNNLPPDIDTAIAFANSLPLKPSIIVSSGYGIHAYWLLTDFIPFTDAETKNAGADLILKWQGIFKKLAAQKGYDIDATQDITRVLRVPDTLNWKVPEDPKPAQLIFIDISQRYTPAQFHEYIDKAELPAIAATNGKKKDTTPSLKSFNDIELDINADASVSGDIFEGLTENVTKFKATWNRTRKDLLDQSGSTYDISLCNMAVAYGLDNQTICNLLIAHRRKHNDVKLRLDYFQRTIADSRNALQGTLARQIAVNRHTDKNDKDQIRADLFTILGVRIEKIDMMLTEPPNFIIYFSDGKHKNFGDAQGLFDQNLFRRHVGNTIRKVVKKMKDLQYESVVQKMFDLAEEITVADEVTEVGDVRDILNTYISESLILNATEKQHKENAVDHAPAVIGGLVSINALHFWQFAKRKYGYKKEKKDLVAVLKRLNAARDTFNIRDAYNTQRSVSVYQMPSEWTPPDAVRPDKAETDFEQVK